MFIILFLLMIAMVCCGVGIADIFNDINDDFMPYFTDYPVVEELDLSEWEGLKFELEWMEEEDADTKDDGLVIQLDGKTYVPRTVASVEWEQTDKSMMPQPMEPSILAAYKRGENPYSKKVESTMTMELTPEELVLLD